MIWHLADEQRYTAFREVTEAASFAMNQGLPGRIWKTGEPGWIVNVQDHDNFPRNRLNDNLGVKAAFGFPVKVKGETVAILEFFTEEEIIFERDLTDCGGGGFFLESPFSIRESTRLSLRLRLARHESPR